MHILRLWPFSEAELIGRPMATMEGWFEERSRIGHGRPEERNSYLERLCRGGYPEVGNLEPSIRDDWFHSYVETVTRRDMFQLADIRRRAAVSRLLRWTHSQGKRHPTRLRVSRIRGLTSRNTEMC